MKECKSNNHKYSNSPYPKDDVPIELFVNEKSNEPFKSCLDCRLYSRKIDTKCRQKRKALIAESIESNTGFILCAEASHNKNGSIHPHNKVPIELFRKEQDNPKSILLGSCVDCRNFAAAKQRDIREIKKSNATEKGLFYCTNCWKEKPSSENALNKDGTNSTLCVICKVGEKERSIKLRSTLRVIKREYIAKYQSSCYICNNIFLSDKFNNIALELSTYLRDNIRYVEFDNKEYTSIEFIKIYHDQLEVNILQFDHLTEEEQRERGMLLPHEPFIPKKCLVSKASSESAMRLEALKCQLLCARCHTMETIRREKGTPHNSKSHLERKKLEYASKIKANGCEICKYMNPDLPRFFDFDHIDPSIKIKEIARMIKDNKYTFDEMVAELSKCRVLCHHCHMIHTQNQIDSGIVTNKLRNNNSA